MTYSDRGSRKSRNVAPLYVGFDGQQVVVRTDLPSIRQFFVDTYGHMISADGENVIGSLDVMGRGSGLVILMNGVVQLEEPHLPVSGLLMFLKRDINELFVRARPDLLWLHAGVVAIDGTALLLCGPSGQGKSTLTTLLCERGWEFLSDDVAPIRQDSGEVLPFPQTPSRRIDPGRIMPPSEVAALVRETVPMARVVAQGSAVSIFRFVFLEYQRDSVASLDLMPKGTGAIELLRNTTNFFDLREVAVDGAVSLLRSVPAYHLTYGNPSQACNSLIALMGGN